MTLIENGKVYAPAPPGRRLDVRSREEAKSERKLRVLGIGVDENGAAVVENTHFRVLGDNALYVVGGSTATYTNIAELEADHALSLFDVRLHVLSHGDTFDLGLRRADGSAAADLEKELVEEMR